VGSFPETRISPLWGGTKYAWKATKYAKGLLLCSSDERDVAVQPLLSNLSGSPSFSWGIVEQAK